MALAIDEHHALIRRLIKKHKGYEVKTIGDSFMIAFNDASNAVLLAEELQWSFFLKSGRMKAPDEEESTVADQIDTTYITLDSDRIIGNEEPLEVLSKLSANYTEDEYKKLWRGLRVRIGINTGYGEIKKDKTTGGYDYYGPVVNTAARIEAVAHGGQVIFSPSTLDSCDDVLKDRPVIPLGSVQLRGFPDPIDLYQIIVVPGRMYPPLRLDVEINLENVTSGNENDSFDTSSQLSRTYVKNNAQSVETLNSFHSQSKTDFTLISPKKIAEDSFSHHVVPTVAKTKEHDLKKDTSTDLLFSPLDSDPPGEEYFEDIFLPKLGTSFTSSLKDHDLTTLSLRKTVSLIITTLYSVISAKRRKDQLRLLCDCWSLNSKILIEKASQHFAKKEKMSLSEDSFQRKEKIKGQKLYMVHHETKSEDFTNLENKLNKALINALVRKLTPLIKKLMVKEF